MLENDSLDLITFSPNCAKLLKKYDTLQKHRVSIRQGKGGKDRDKGNFILTSLLLFPVRIFKDY